MHIDLALCFFLLFFQISVHFFFTHSRTLFFFSLFKCRQFFFIPANTYKLLSFTFSDHLHFLVAYGTSGVCDLLRSSLYPQIRSHRHTRRFPCFLLTSIKFSTFGQTVLYIIMSKFTIRCFNIINQCLCIV